MADCDIFREQLAIKYPSYGLALWEPSPRYPDKPVQVGDVGFIRKGKFHRLFNVFERGHQSPQYEGTGIGLAIVRKAAEKMGGKVGVVSDGISGSSFWLELPAVYR